MLADDLTIILTNLKSIENVLKLLNNFSICSGLNINEDKSKAKTKFRNLNNTRPISAWSIMDQNTPSNAWNIYHQQPRRKPNLQI